jgi:tuftelin-interacting protein 11
MRHRWLTLRFTWWKSRFPEKVLSMPAIAHGFTSGLDLMQEAMHLGADAPSKLRKPVYQPPTDRGLKSTTKAKSSSGRTPATSAAAVGAPEITFRTLAEDVATQNDLVFFPTGRSDPTTGKPLFKVSQSADGRGGVLVYVTGDAVFAQNEEGGFRVVSLEEMVRRGKL